MGKFSTGNGISPNSAEFLMSSGVDVITTGNHAFRRKQMDDTYRTSDYIIRPHNYGSECVGKGFASMILVVIVLLSST